MRRNKVLTTLAAVSMSALMAVTTMAPAVPALAAETTSTETTQNSQALPTWKQGEPANDLKDFTTQDAFGVYNPTYDGTQKLPTITIRDSAGEIPSSEYTIKLADQSADYAVNVGTYHAIVTAKDGSARVKGSVEFDFDVEKADANFTIDQVNVTSRDHDAINPIVRDVNGKDVTSNFDVYYYGTELHADGTKSAYAKTTVKPTHPGVYYVIAEPKENTYTNYAVHVKSTQFTFSRVNADVTGAFKDVTYNTLPELDEQSVEGEERTLTFTFSKITTDPETKKEILTPVDGKVVWDPNDGVIANTSVLEPGYYQVKAVADDSEVVNSAVNQHANRFHVYKAPIVSLKADHFRKLYNGHAQEKLDLHVYGDLKANGKTDDYDSYGDRDDLEINDSNYDYTLTYNGTPVSVETGKVVNGKKETTTNLDEKQVKANIVKAGTYVITAVAKPDSLHYQGSASVTLTVNKRNQKPTVDVASKVYDGQAVKYYVHTPVANPTVTFKNVKTGAVTTTAPVHAGTYEVWVASKGNDEYNEFANAKVAEFTIDRAHFDGDVESILADATKNNGYKNVEYNSLKKNLQLVVKSQLNETLTAGKDYDFAYVDGDGQNVLRDQYGRVLPQVTKITFRADSDYEGVVVGKANSGIKDEKNHDAEVDTDLAYFINPLNLSAKTYDEQARINDATYTGKDIEIAPLTKVYAYDGTVLPATDYTLDKTTAKEIGKHAVNISGTNKNTTGHTVEYFQINEDTAATNKNNEKAAQDLIDALKESNKTSKDALEQAQKQAEEAQKQSEAQQQIADNTKKEEVVKTQNVYRVYNPNSGEHLYTTSKGEVNSLAKLGWRDEGIGWKGLTAETGKPVYRLYNKNGGEHFYTLSSGEKNNLVKHGWRDEGIAFYAADQKNGVAVYRQYNKNQFANNHNFTTNDKERAHLVNIGWKDEGVAWYAAK